MIRSEGMSSIARYEVILIPSEVSLMGSDWTWRRFESDSQLSAQGSRHTTLPDCFAEVREHARQFGRASVAVNLLGDAAPPSPAAPSLAAVPARDGAVANRLAPKALLRRRSALRG